MRGRDGKTPLDRAYDDNMRGVLFPNHKRTSDASPDYTGKVNIGGKEWRLAAWAKESKAGNAFLSLSISEFQEAGTFKPKGHSAETRAESAQASPEFNDDIPF